MTVDELTVDELTVDDLTWYHLTGSIGKPSIRHPAVVELERVPDSTRRPGPEEKLVVNKPSTQYYQGPSL